VPRFSTEVEVEIGTAPEVITVVYVSIFVNPPFSSGGTVEVTVRVVVLSWIVVKNVLRSV
jgi:hypothetical protein